LDNVSQFIDSKFQIDSQDAKILHYNADRSKGLINPNQLFIDEIAGYSLLALFLYVGISNL
ncbi:hypothetical protein OAS32_05390, partial [Candidatus Pseudothioglobus singularis]|nr:hypothetical protein [Candidatus Pseudothioglobus singularis]